ncbi:FAD binding domain-containing protein [Candidatus Bipolaricaulota bacterium]|nr:FAD binding domain-containing protein [Candidatus Bipolaricaulota bacterium]
MRVVINMRLKGIRRFHYARDLEEALSLLSAYGGRGAVLAGGLDLARSARADLEGLIDISGLGLSYVRAEGGGLRIGATTTLTDLLECRAAREYLGGFLVEVLKQVAAPPLRNQATFGGAVVSAHPWADIPTVLVALGAEVSFQDEAGRHKGLLEELWEKPFRHILKGAVLTEVILPPWDGAFAFEKLTRSAYDIALLNCACGLGIQEGRISWARVALGATPRRGRRLPWLEDLLVGKEPGPELWAEVKELVPEKVEVGTDRRASGDWRRAVAGPLLTRCLARAARKVTGGNL